MKVVSSLKTLKTRDRNCQIVRRRGRLYVINKKNPRLKARQGQRASAAIYDAVHNLEKRAAGSSAVFCWFADIRPGK